MSVDLREPEQRMTEDAPKAAAGSAVRFDDSVLRQVASEVRAIKSQYTVQLAEELIDKLVEESLQRLAGSRVPQFVPLFVGRFTRRRIKEILLEKQL